MTSQNVQRLMVLLETEQTALKEGNFSDLDRILAEKSSCMETFTTEKVSAAELRGLQQKAARNQSALAASREGIRAVLRRISDLNRMQDGADVYAKDGRRHTMKAGKKGNRA